MYNTVLCIFDNCTFMIKWSSTLEIKNALWSKKKKSEYNKCLTNVSQWYLAVDKMFFHKIWSTYIVRYFRKEFNNSLEPFKGIIFLAKEITQYLFILILIIKGILVFSNEKNYEKKKENFFVEG